MTDQPIQSGSRAPRLDEEIGRDGIGVVGRALRWRRRNRLVANLAALAAALLVATVVTALVGYWQTRKHLHDSLLYQARAVSRTTATDRRFEAIDALKRAARIRPGIDVRNEYLRCLDLPGLRPVAAIPPESAEPDRSRRVPRESRPQSEAVDWYSGRTVSGRFAFRGSDERIVGIVSGSVETHAPREFDPASGEMVGELSGVPRLQEVIALSDDGRWLIGQPKTKLLGYVSPNEDPPAQVWDLQEQRLVGELPSEKATKASGERRHRVKCAAFSAKPGRLAVAYDHSQAKICVYDLPSLGIVGSWTVKGMVIGLSFHPERPLLAASVHAQQQGSESPFRGVQQVVLWNLPKGDQVAAMTAVREVGDPLATRDMERSVAFSPGGQVVLVGGCDGSIKGWDILSLERHEGPQEILSIAGHAGKIAVLRLSPDSRWLASAGNDRQLKIWDAATGKLAMAERVDAWTGGATFPRVHVTLEWSPSGGLLLSDATNGKGIRIREFVAPLSAVHRLQGSVSLLFSPDDRYLSCSASPPGRPTLIDLASPGPRQTWLGHAFSYGTLAQAFSHDSARLWGTTWHSGVLAEPVYTPQISEEIYQLPDRKRIAEKDDWTRQVQSAAFDASGRRLAAGKETGFVLKVMGLDASQELWTHAERTVDWDRRLLPTPGSHRLAVAFHRQHWAYQFTIQTLDWNTGKVVAEQQASPGVYIPAQSDRFARVPDSVGQAAAKAGTGVGVRTWPPTFSADGSIAALSAGNSILIFNTGDWKLRNTIARGKTVPWTLALNRDGSRLAAMDGSELKVWNTTEGKELGKVQANPAWLAFVQSEKDGEHLLLVQRDLVVLSWRPGSEIRKVCTLEAPERPEARIDIYQLFVSEDGSRVAACWDLRAAGVWALPQGKLIFRWSPGRYSEQLDISLRPDGKRLAILQRYATDKVWDADADRELLSLETAGSLRLSRDGRYLLYSRSPPFDSNRNSRPPPLRIFDLADKSVLFSAKEYAGELALADEALLLAAVRDNVIRIYDPHTGEAIAFRDRGSKKKADYLTLPSGKATAVAFDGSATLLACACDDGAIRLFNPRTGDELAIFETEENWSQVAISPSGNWLAVGNPGGVVRVWDLSLTRQQLRDIGLDWPTTGPD